MKNYPVFGSFDTESGSSVTTDVELSATSENPVQNKAIVAAITNPNLLDNGDFSINQRGQSVYDATSAGLYKYTVDRWCFWKYNSDNYGAVTVNADGSLSVDGADGADDCILTQVVENGIELVGKIVTLSLEITEITGTVMLQLHKSSANIYISKPGVYQLTFGWPELDIYRICINNTNCSHYTIKWMKLELGSVATAFVPPNPAVELSKCQRYQMLGPMQATYLYSRSDGNSCVVFLPLPVTPRITPSIIGTPRVQSVKDNTQSASAVVSVCSTNYKNGALLLITGVSAPHYIYFPAGAGIDMNL